MSRQLALIVVAIGSGIVAALRAPYLNLTSVADKAPVVIAVFMAALFVRLARGVPPFPFEKISKENSDTILASLDHLRKMYGHAFFAFLLTIIIAIGYTPLMDRLHEQMSGNLLTGVLVTSLVWSGGTAVLVYRTDISLFKAQAIAMRQVVDDLAATAAADTLKTVRRNLRTSPSEMRGDDNQSERPL